MDSGLQSKGKNGVTGVYLSVMNLASHNRSQRNGFLTVQVIRNSQIKDHGFNACFERLVNDLKDLILTGFILPNGKKVNVRVVQFLMDNLEKHKVMRIMENFANSTFFSSYSYITSLIRKSARELEEILPEKFEKRTETTYKVGSNYQIIYVIFVSLPTVKRAVSTGCRFLLNLI